MGQRSPEHIPAGGDLEPDNTPRNSVTHSGTTAVAVLSCCVIIAAGVAGIIQQLHLREVVQVTLSWFVEAHDLAEDVEVQILQCRRYEKDYFLNIADPEKRAGNLEKWHHEWEELDEEIDKILQAPAQVQEIVNAEALKENADNYRRLFLDLVTRIEAGEIRDPVQANELFTPSKRYAHQILKDADHRRMRRGMRSTSKTICSRGS